MISLPEISAELATYFSMAAGTLGTALMEGAAQRVADGSIEAGQGYFRRLFRLDEADDSQVELPQGGSEERADALLGALSSEDRLRLAEALAAWVGEVRDRQPGKPHLGEARLAELIGEKVHTATYNVTANGPNSAAIGSVGPSATFHFGGSGRDGTGI
ncbi:hypothetical protein ABTX35_06125 [Streptomyces sp. NPDC096080]|uniref:hypothetical protein n=1 Tax=Streptomyces sp. NPDC096080 TaxID=3156693 RepID=UPI003326270E